MNPREETGKTLLALVLLMMLLGVLGGIGGLLSGCAGTDPLLVHALERNRQVWDEDRRQDLDPELVKSRIAEFDAQLRLANSK